MRGTADSIGPSITSEMAWLKPWKFWMKSNAGCGKVPKMRAQMEEAVQEAMYEVQERLDGPEWTKEESLEMWRNVFLCAQHRIGILEGSIIPIDRDSE